MANRHRTIILFKNLPRHLPDQDDEIMDYQMRKVMFSSKHGYHRTPQDLFNQLHSEFHFDVDVCYDPIHPLGTMYGWTGDDGLNYSWKGLRCYMNPPYQRGIIEKWLEKAEYERFNGVMTVALLPCRTDTKWWWAFCLDKEVRIIRGRIKFSGMQTGAPFPSCIVIFKP